ncbi:MAG: zinc-dependent alcohol dehydrogenase family protein [Cyclobacteriaceae bacterium]|nr:zinc-dependent alcohol dehydrogenase family protein [Cyclobacteriaceae bacterium]
MRAIIFEDFCAPLKIATVPDPIPENDGVVIKVMASGICRSDWHGWLGRDPDITELPHVPGHELAGTVEEIGKNVTQWKRGDRVTVPFVCGCGSCPECKSGNHQICDNQFQPGFTHWGSFAQYVSIKYVDTNLVRLPDDIDFVTGASLGCRFSTSFRAINSQGEVKPGQWVAVHGCGGVGLSAVMISNALGANVIAIDINSETLKLAKSLGASILINAEDTVDVVGEIREVTKRGAHVSIDALGSLNTCSNSILCLRKGGRHVQVGLMVGDDYLPRLPMDQVIAKELQIYGSHGMQANKYGSMFEMISSGKLNPGLLIGKTIQLEEAPKELKQMDQFDAKGITVIDRF